MSKNVYGPEGDRSHAILPMTLGGSGTLDRFQAPAKLGLLNDSRANSPSGYLKLDGSGKVPMALLDKFVNKPINIAAVSVGAHYVNASFQYRVLGADTASLIITKDAGTPITVTASDNILTVVATASGTHTFWINGVSVTVTVVARVMAAPVLNNGLTGVLSKVLNDVVSIYASADEAQAVWDSPFKEFVWEVLNGAGSAATYTVITNGVQLYIAGTTAATGEFRVRVAWKDQNDVVSPYSPLLTIYPAWNDAGPYTNPDSTQVHEVGYMGDFLIAPIASGASVNYSKRRYENGAQVSVTIGNILKPDDVTCFGTSWRVDAYDGAICAGHLSQMMNPVSSQLYNINCRLVYCHADFNGGKALTLPRLYADGIEYFVYSGSYRTGRKGKGICGSITRYNNIGAGFVVYKYVAKYTYEPIVIKINEDVGYTVKDVDYCQDQGLVLVTYVDNVNFPTAGYIKLYELNADNALTLKKTFASALWGSVAASAIFGEKDGRAIAITTTDSIGTQVRSHYFDLENGPSQGAVVYVNDTITTGSLFSMRPVSVSNSRRWFAISCRAHFVLNYNTAEDDELFLGSASLGDTTNVVATQDEGGNVVFNAGSLRYMFNTLNHMGGRTATYCDSYLFADASRPVDLPNGALNISYAAFASGYTQRSNVMAQIQDCGSTLEAYKNESYAFQTVEIAGSTLRMLVVIYDRPATGFYAKAFQVLDIGTGNNASPQFIIRMSPDRTKLLVYMWDMRVDATPSPSGRVAVFTRSGNTWTREFTTMDFSKWVSGYPANCRMGEFMGDSGVVMLIQTQHTTQAQNGLHFVKKSGATWSIVLQTAPPAGDTNVTSMIYTSTSQKPDAGGCYRIFGGSIPNYVPGDRAYLRYYRYNPTTNVNTLIWSQETLNTRATYVSPAGNYAIHHALGVSAQNVPVLTVMRLSDTGVPNEVVVPAELLNTTDLVQFRVWFDTLDETVFYVRAVRTYDDAKIQTGPGRREEIHKFKIKWLNNTVTVERVYVKARHFTAGSMQTGGNSPVLGFGNDGSSLEVYENTTVRTNAYIYRPS